MVDEFVAAVALESMADSAEKSESEGVLEGLALPKRAPVIWSWRAWLLS